MPIKLFVDCHAFDQKLRQGITTYLAGLYQAAVKLDFPVEYYFAACSPEHLEPIFGTGKHIHYLRYQTHSKYQRLLFEIPALIQREKIDYAHFQYIVPFRKTCKEIVTLHDILFCDFPEQFSWKYRMSKSLLFRWSAKRADVLLTVSNYSKQRISQLWNIPESEITVTPNAVSEEWCKPPAADAALTAGMPFSKYILFVSRIEPRKNHALLLRCFRELELWKQGIGLVFIGAPAEKSQAFEEEMQKLPKEASAFVVMKHNVPFAELRRWYAGTALFVFPSLAEGFGIPPLEAGMSGVPCLCSNQTAMSDFDFLGEGMFDPKEPGALKNKISDFFSGNLKLPDNEMIRKKITDSFSWKKSAEVLLSEIIQW